jgi:hypothetical protein
LWLYAIVPSHTRRRLAPDLAGAAFRFSAPGAGAVVARFEEEMAELTEENLWNHERVVEAVRGKGPAIPFHFGTVVDEQALCESFTAAGRSVQDELSRLDGMEQYCLKLLWDFEGVRSVVNRQKELQADDGEGPGGRLDRQERLESPGADYLRSREELYSLHDGLAEDARRVTGPVHSLLSSKAEESSAATLASRAMVLSARYLVARRSKQDFEQALRSLVVERPLTGVMASGPWPPYDFVRIKLDHVEAISCHPNLL